MSHIDEIKAKMKAVRESAGITPTQMAKLAAYSRPCIVNVESPRRARDVAKLAVYVAAYDKALKTGGLLADYWAALQEGDEVRRRALVFALGTAAGAGIASGPYVAEALRGSMLRALGGDDWPELVAEYGRRFMTTAPAPFASGLAGDLINLKTAIEASDSEYTRAAAAKLMTLQGMGTANLGDTIGAQRWYRAARVAADSTDDRELRSWVRARAAFRSGYEGGDPVDILATAAGVEGQVEAYLALGQAYARLGQPTRALEALAMARRAHDGSGQDEATIYDMPGWRMALSASYVYALLGRPDDCVRELVATPPPKLRRWGAQHQMQMAVALSRAGDAVAGARLARDVLTSIPVEQRSIVLHEMHREAMRGDVAGSGPARAGNARTAGRAVPRDLPIRRGQRPY